MGDADGSGPFLVVFGVLSVEVQGGGVQVDAAWGDPKAASGLHRHADEDLAKIGLKELIQNPPQLVVI